MLFSSKTATNLTWEEEGRLRKWMEVQHREANKPNMHRKPGGGLTEPLTNQYRT